MDSKANGDASGSEYDEPYGDAETETDSIADDETDTDSRLDGKMMNNLYYYKHWSSVVQCRRPRVLLIRIG